MFKYMVKITYDCSTGRKKSVFFVGADSRDGAEQKGRRAFALARTVLTPLSGSCEIVDIEVQLVGRVTN